MNNIMKLYLVSESDELFGDIQRYFQSKNNKELSFEVHQFHKFEELIAPLSSSLPFAVIVDKTKDHEICKKQLQFISAMKSFEFTKSIPLCYIFESEQQANSFENLLTCGVSLFHVLGNDLKQFLANLFYITFEYETDTSKYALSKGYDIDFSLSAISSLHSFTDETIVLDSDIAPSSTSLVKLNLFDDLPKLLFPIIESNSEGKSSNCFYHLYAKIPFASGWDEAEDVLFEDTFTSWVTNNKKDFKQGNINILHYSKDLSDLNKAYQILDGDETYKIKSQYDPATKDLYKFKPHLIFFEISTEQCHEQFHQLASDLNYLKSNSDLIVCVFGHNSHSNALKKMYQYERIIASKHKSNHEMLKTMIQTFKEKSKDQHYYLPLDDKRKVAYQDIDVKITSISENSITFKTIHELPFYSVYKIEVPAAMHLLIIPSKLNLSAYPDGHHYQALIMGIDSKTSEYLRKYVNKLISSPPKSWEYIDLDHVEVENEQATLTQEQESEKDTNIINDNLDEDDNLSITRKKTSKYKSKL